jgi:hypothetical protein
VFWSFIKECKGTVLVSIFASGVVRGQKTGDWRNGWAARALCPFIVSIIGRSQYTGCCIYRTLACSFRFLFLFLFNHVTFALLVARCRCRG